MHSYAWRAALLRHGMVQNQRCAVGCGGRFNQCIQSSITVTDSLTTTTLPRDPFTSLHFTSLHFCTGPRYLVTFASQHNDER